MPARVRSERTSLSNCANAASTPSISLPVEVSSIGSVAERREIPSDCRCDRSAKWVVLVPREARQVEHHQEMHAAFVQPTVREQALKLAAIRGLGALAFLVESFEDFIALAVAVLFARAKLCRQAEILGLLLRADANVDHRADHDRQRRSIRRVGQAASTGHSLYSEARHCFWYISTTMHAIVSACRRMSSTP